MEHFPGGAQGERGFEAGLLTSRPPPPGLLPEPRPGTDSFSAAFWDYFINPEKQDFTT